MSLQCLSCKNLVGLNTVIPPFEKRIGVLGGGQLGKMLIESAMPWNVRYTVLEADPEAPAVKYAHTFIQGKLSDAAKIHELSEHCDLITYEIEHVNIHALLELEQSGKEIIPSANVLRIIQDKGLQKQFFTARNLPTAPFVIIEHPGEIDKIQKLGPLEKVVVKSCKEGYDGRGVMVMQTKNLLDNDGKLPFPGACVVEIFLEGAREFSVIVARNRRGEVKTYPLIEMVFEAHTNLVEYLFSPAAIPAAHTEQANQLAIKAIEGLNGVGIFAVELFFDRKSNWYINEIAPRPHNSGHHTIEACYTSQYEQLNRILLDLPLGDTQLIKPAAMVNLTGPEGIYGNYKITGLEACLRTPGFYLHLYDKKTIKPNRKMGHFTVMAANVDDAMDKALQLKQHIRFEEIDQEINE